MRLGTYITESTKVDHGEIVDALVKDCKPFLKDIKWDRGEVGVIYSGREYEHRLFYDRKIRKDRKPKDSNIILHNALDSLFKEYFGVKARSESLFVTGNKHIAISYGEIYAIIPKGGYKIIWSMVVNDVYNYIKNNDQKLFDVIEVGKHSDYVADVISDIFDIDLDIKTDIKIEADYNKKYGEDGPKGIWVYNLNGYTQDDRERFGLGKKPRIVYIKGFSKDDIKRSLLKMFGGDKSYVHDYDIEWVPDATYDDYKTVFDDDVYDKLIDKYIKELFDNLTDYISELINIDEYRDGDINSAINSANEIMLSNKDGYYAVSRDVFYVVLKYFAEFGYNTISNTIKKDKTKFEMFVNNSDFSTGLIKRGK